MSKNTHMVDAEVSLKLHNDDKTYTLSASHDVNDFLRAMGSETGEFYIGVTEQYCTRMPMWEFALLYGGDVRWVEISRLGGDLLLVGYFMFSTEQVTEFTVA